VSVVVNAAPSGSLPRGMSERYEVCGVDELPSGARRRIDADGITVIVVNCDGALLAIEDVCSHDGAPLDDGPIDCAAGTIQCPRHGSLFDLRSGRPKTLPAYMPVETFAVEIDGGRVVVIVD
jgi:3-phenylpropionate/trans-cinnamate dioxygenase ferredoxin subunit